MSKHLIFTIGEAAQASGLTAKMIRNYEALGLINSQQRSSGNYRLYTSADLEKLRFIKQARSLDFSLKQIAELLMLWQKTDRTSADVKVIALKHQKAIESRIEDLQSLHQQLGDLIGACKGTDDPDCAILKGLAKGESLQSCCQATSATPNIPTN